MKTLLRTLILATSVCVAVGPVLAAGSDTGGSGTEPAAPKPEPASPKALKCKKSEVLKTETVNGVRKKKCVKLQSSELTDSEYYEQGYALAQEGEYDWALQVLAVVQNQQDPDVLNMQGYSHRKSGRLEVAIGYYRKALDINPDFVRAREYLGEGYVKVGRIDLAQAELLQIKLRCGVECEEYKLLSAAISSANN